MSDAPLFPIPKMGLRLIPAYGRRYAHHFDAQRDWLAGKDFRILGGPYTSIRDFEELRKLACGHAPIILWNYGTDQVGWILASPPALDLPPTQRG